MKLFIYFSATVVFILSITLFGCRKETLKDHPRNFKEFTSDCNNGIQDGTETGVDCGGSCAPCATVDLSCNMSNNTFEYVTTLSNSYTGLLTNGEGNVNLVGGGTFHVDFGDNPTSSGVYTAKEFASGEYDFTCYFVPNGGGLYDSDNTSGNVMVTVSSSGYNIEFCDLMLTANGGSTYKNVSGNINFN